MALCVVQQNPAWVLDKKHKMLYLFFQWDEAYLDPESGDWLGFSLMFDFIKADKNDIKTAPWVIGPIHVWRPYIDGYESLIRRIFDAIAKTIGVDHVDIFSPLAPQDIVKALHSLGWHELTKDDLC